VYVQLMLTFGPASGVVTVATSWVAIIVSMRLDRTFRRLNQ